MCFSHRRHAIAVGAALCAIVLGCSSPVGPNIEPQVSNAPDDFQYQLPDARGYAGSTTYTWTNSGARATIVQSSTITFGNIWLTITDAAGAQVHSASLFGSGTFRTPVGAAGSWSIRLDYAGANGEVRFRVTKL